jgi:hypothetical protein
MKLFHYVSYTFTTFHSINKTEIGNEYFHSFANYERSAGDQREQQVQTASQLHSATLLCVYAKIKS